MSSSTRKAAEVVERAFIGRRDRLGRHEAERKAVVVVPRTRGITRTGDREYDYESGRVAPAAKIPEPAAARCRVRHRRPGQ